jgi:hypothetical protein
MQTRFCFVFTTLLVTAAAAFGQSMATGMTSSSFSSGPDGSFKGSATFNGGPSFPAATVAGAPYSGDEVTETVQTLADGTHITHTMPGPHVSRDSAGRTRVERALVQRPTGMPATAGFPADVPTIVEITDPVAGCRYVLDPMNHIAHRIAIQARPLPARLGPGAAGGAPQLQLGAGSGDRAVTRTGVMSDTLAPPPQGVPGAPGAVGFGAPRAAQSGQALRPTTEDLGSQMIDGVLVAGTRTTTTIPVGVQGNDRPLVNTTETWISPDLKITVLRVTTSPISGVQTFRIENLSRTAPDPILFMPPADYTVVDETGSFTINFGQ